MSSRTLLNLALALLVLLLVAVVWLRPGLEQDESPPALTTVLPDGVTSINITRLEAEPLGFRKQGNDWFVDEDPLIPADNFQVRNILGLLEAGSVRSYPADALELTALGLDPPQASILFNNVRVSIGGIEPIDNLRYIRTASTVHLVDDRYQHLLNASYYNFVRRRLLPEDARISGLHLPGLALQQTDGVDWRLEPEMPGVSADSIDALIGNWLRASALFIRRLQPGDYTETVTLTLSGRDEPVVFTVVSRSPDLVLARPEWGIQYHLPAENGLDLLSLPPAPETGR